MNLWPGEHFLQNPYFNKNFIFVKSGGNQLFDWLAD